MSPLRTAGAVALATCLLAGTTLASEPPTVQPLPQDAGVRVLHLPADASEPFELPLSLDGEPLRLGLAAHSVRGADFRVAASGQTLDDVPPLTTVRGVILGEAGSSVVGSLVDGQLSVWIQRGAGREGWVIEPAGAAGPGRSHAEHLVQPESALPIDGLLSRCGVALPDLHGETERQAPTGSFSSGTVKVCELAVDADHEYYTLNGSSVAETVADVELVVNLTSSVYETEVGVRHVLNFVNVWDSEPDPYTDVPATSNTLLTEFRNYWNANFTGVQRDLAHLFTGKSMHLYTGHIGYASISVLCNPTFGYAWSQARFSTSPRTRTKLVAHELGHNFSAVHCDGQGDCNTMCSIINGCLGGSGVEFGASATTSILNKIASTSCLSDGPGTTAPVLTGASPSQVVVLDGGWVHVTGSGLETTTLLTVDGVDLSLWSNGFQIVGPDEVRFFAATATHLGAVSITATNPGGTSNAVSFDYIEADPPVLSTYEWALPDFPHTWTWAGPIGDTATLLIAFSPLTVGTVGGPQILANPVTQLSAMLQFPVGIDSYTRLIPQSLDDVDFWSQVVVEDAFGNLTATPVIRTCVGWSNPCN